MLHFSMRMKGTRMWIFCFFILYVIYLASVKSATDNII